MTTASNSSRFRGAGLALLLVAGASPLTACDDRAAVPDGNGPQADALAALTTKVAQLTDLEAIRAIPACYGYGHDLIFGHLGGDHSDALAALRRCHTDDLVTNVYLFDETKPVQRLGSITELIGFVETFAKKQGYSSARNVPGNIQVEMTGPSSARVLSSTVAPHFLTLGPASPSDRPTIDLVEARYVDTVERGADGVWRSVALDLVVQQIWRGEGAYPFAAP